MSSLVDIAIFTDDEEVPLGEVFDKIFEKEDGGEAISHKSSPDELKKYFGEVLPDYDRDRVYVSDIKKLINWYNTLHSLELLVPGTDAEEDADKPGDQENTEKADEAEKDLNPKQESEE